MNAVDVTDVKTKSFTITELWVYPVKSCAGYSVDSVTLTPRGLENDRLYMIVRPDGKFLTQRELPALCLIHPTVAQNTLRLNTASHPEIVVPRVETGEFRTVTVWNDTCIAMDQGQAAADWLQSVLGTECRLVRMSEEHARPVKQHYGNPDDIVSFADGLPVLVASEASLQDLNSRMTTSIPMDRFRPNIIVKGDVPFEEDYWLKLCTDNIEVEFVDNCSRCVITTIDQKSSSRAVEPLKTLATYRANADNEVLFGRYGIPRRLGVIKAGELASFSIGR